MRLNHIAVYITTFYTRRHQLENDLRFICLNEQREKRGQARHRISASGLPVKGRFALPTGSFCICDPLLEFLLICLGNWLSDAYKQWDYFCPSLGV